MSSKVELLAKNIKFQIVLAIIVFVIIVGVIGPFFTMDPKEYTGAQYESPSWNHKLGTDVFGRDIWAQLIHGIRNSLIVGFTAGLIALVIAFVIGGIGAYVGGLIDEILNFTSNVFLVLPIVPILIILSLLVRERSFFLVASIIAVTGWPGTARAIRSQILSLKEREFVDLARISGKSNIEILFTEIFPNMLAYVFIQFCGMVGGAIMSEAGISLIGLGPTTEFTLGSILHWSIACHAITMGIWYWFVPPGLVLIIFAGSLISLGTVIDDVLNPKLAHRATVQRGRRKE